jgi:hypothetical protein
VEAGFPSDKREAFARRSCSNKKTKRSYHKIVVPPLVFASQPFRNQLITLTLTGAQIRNMLEQQWLDPKRPRILQLSKGFNYVWDGAKPYGERVIADRMTLNGRRIDPAMNYRVTVNNFLAVGGDGFTVLKGPPGKSASTTSMPCIPISRPTVR